jgi:NTE family protein
LISKKFILFLFLLCSFFGYTQKVGLVLSGGGALGLAHVGVLKALEENNIPVDYITGTSAGAMIGSMYSAGISPQQMEHLFFDDKFDLMSNGGVETQYKYFFRKTDSDASMVNFRFSKDFNVPKSLPTNLTNSISLDFEYMKQYSNISAQANYNFDSLFVPFRCVASDISTKSQVVFGTGHLNQAVRASMTYPGYIRPIKVGGKLLFDGGLYNNFPSDIMYDEFMPDIIIGVNFTDTAVPPDQDDPISQLKTMILNRAETSIICENGIIIEPKASIGIFDFGKAEEIVQDGYDATMALMDSIKDAIQERVSDSVLLQKRIEFRKKLKPIYFEEVIVEGVTENQAKYIKSALIRNKEIISLEELQKRFFRLAEDEKVKNIYPLAQYNEVTGNYKLVIQVKPEKPFNIQFGGLFSSRPINTGYLGVEYLRLNKFAFKLSANSYFGKFYGSVGARVDIEANYRLPIKLGVYGYISRWDFFKSFATFFEDIKPSYIVENERYVGVDLQVPISHFGKITISYDIGLNENNYYQTEQFSASDTADATNFEAESIGVNYKQSTLNRKTYASEGGLVHLQANYIFGKENTLPGSTSSLDSPAENIDHIWYFFKGRLEQYFKISKHIKFGAEMEGLLFVIDNFLDNYTATKIQAPSYYPTVESKTFFISEHASHDYVAGGLKAIFSVRPSLDLRVEGFVFQPHTEILANEFNLPSYDIYNAWSKRYYIGSGSLVYSSPLGPVSLSANYYEARENKWSFLFNFGYLIYNERFLKK